MGPEMRAVLEKLSRDLTDRGMLVEAGWIGLRIACMAEDAPEDQLREMKMAFMAGALHLFSSIMTIMEAGDEPTASDMRRMDLIDRELRTFGEQFALNHTPTTGGRR